MYKKSLIDRYDKPPAEGNPRETEAWAFNQAAQRLYRANDANDEEELKEALRLNWKLWTIVQTSVLDENCQLPMDIRRDVARLANFVDQTTVALLIEIKSESVEELIDINRQLAFGLRAKSEDAKQAKPPPPPTGVGEDV